MSEEHDQVEVPENAIRDDPIAFGLTAPQLGLAGAAAAVAFVLNLLPIWLPLRLGLAILAAAPGLRRRGDLDPWRARVPLAVALREIRTQRAALVRCERCDGRLDHCEIRPV